MSLFRSAFVFVIVFNLIFDLLGLAHGALFGSSWFQIWATDIGFAIGWGISTWIVEIVMSPNRKIPARLALWYYLIGIFLGSQVAVLLSFNDSLVIKGDPVWIAVPVLTFVASMSVLLAFVKDGRLERFFPKDLPNKQR